MSSESAAYMSIVDSVVCGPHALKDTEAELCLSIGSQQFKRSQMKRNHLIESGLRSSFVTDEMEGKHKEWGEPIGGQGDGSVHYISNSKENKRQTKVNTEIKNRQREKTFIIDKDKFKTGHSWKCPDLHSQFELFSKFGDSGSTGFQITLSQTDRWLRQAQVIDGWNVTTIDTAIAFRKISKGSIWLEYKLWRAFIEYLSKQKHLNISKVIDKLEKCG
jgi:hypothetical protein